MSNSYSVYAIHEAEKPKWLPGEDLAATAFIAMTFLLVAEINIHIRHVFKEKKGLYYWAMQVGSVACGIDALSLLIDYLIPSSRRVWWLYTLGATVGWATYTVAQLVVLYSRLHLVLRNTKIQRGILLAIVIVSPLLIVPDWIVTWPAWDADTADHWSVVDAIVERIVQLGFSLLEVTINVIYAVSIIQLLRVKSSVRQRRVLLDLVYVNIVAVTLDVLNIILVYLNRIGISHPIQTFSYAMKLRLEFIVLNQLMAVAAKGLRSETFEEKRYHHPTSISDSHGNIGQTRKKENRYDSLGDSIDSQPSDATTSVPQPIFLKATGSTNNLESSEKRLPNLPSPSKGGSPKFDLARYMPGKVRGQRMSGNHGVIPVKMKGKHNGLRHNDEDEPEEEEIGLHMWERKGSHILEVPWFREAAGA